SGRHAPRCLGRRRSKSRRASRGGGREPAVRAAVFLLLAACGGAVSPYASKFAGAERAQSAGRYAEAAAQYDAAAGEEAKPREKEHAAYLGALMHVRAGDVAGGAKILAALGAGNGEHASESLLRL